MMTLKREFYQKLSFHLLMFTLFFLAAAATLSFAYFSEYIEGLTPCPLCLYQRYPYWVVMALSLLGVFFSYQFPYQKKIRFVLYLLITFSFATNIGISFYHFGMEQAWWTDHEICQSKLNDDDDLDEMRKQILATPVADCAIVQWSLFGLSMTGYNFIFSALLFLLSCFGLYHCRKDKNER